jgi:hypothetical protein
MLSLCAGARGGGAERWDTGHHAGDHSTASACQHVGVVVGTAAALSLWRRAGVRPHNRRCARCTRARRRTCAHLSWCHSNLCMVRCLLLCLPCVRSYAGLKLEWGKSIDANNCLVAVKVDPEVARAEAEAAAQAAAAKAAEGDGNNRNTTTGDRKRKRRRREGSAGGDDGFERDSDSAANEDSDGDSSSDSWSGDGSNGGSRSDELCSSDLESSTDDDSLLGEPATPRTDPLNFMERCVLSTCALPPSHPQQLGHACLSHRGIIPPLCLQLVLQRADGRLLPLS